MDLSNAILRNTLLLTWVAGFCDTVTFITANELFSAHVTGNFIVFAYDAVRGADAQSWGKLISFPVFIASVAVGRLLVRGAANGWLLLRAEAALLLACGGLALLAGGGTTTLGAVAAMGVVFAMGLQNAFSRLYAKETYGPTTVMTGNVTQTTLDIAEVAGHGAKPEQGAAIRRQLWVILGFLVGCLTGAVAAKTLGLWAVGLPGLVLLAGVASQGRAEQPAAAVPKQASA